MPQSREIPITERPALALHTLTRQKHTTQHKCSASHARRRPQSLQPGTVGHTPTNLRLCTLTCTRDSGWALGAAHVPRPLHYYAGPVPQGSKRALPCPDRRGPQRSSQAPRKPSGPPLRVHEALQGPGGTTSPAAGRAAQQPSRAQALGPPPQGPGGSAGTGGYYLPGSRARSTAATPRARAPSEVP